MGKGLIFLFVFLILVGGVMAANYDWFFNPFTGRQDRSLSLNQSGFNITADYFIGNGSLLTGIVVVSPGNSSQDILNVVDNYWYYNATRINTTVLVNQSGKLGIVTSWWNGVYLTLVDYVTNNNTITNYVDSKISTLTIVEANITDYKANSSEDMLPIINIEISGNNTFWDTNNDTMTTYVNENGFTNGSHISVGFLDYGMFINYTRNITSGNISNASLIGYEAANHKCDVEYPGSHMCQIHEIINHINAGKSLNNFSATFRISEGAPGYLADANDCNGWSKELGTALGSIWVGETTRGGAASLVSCSATRAIGCCR